MTHFEAVLTIITACIAVVTSIVAAIRIIIRPFTRRLSGFLDDWAGEPARPFVPGRPGVMERLQKLEARTMSTEARTIRIEKEMHPNGGSTVVDKLNRIESAVTGGNQQ